LFDTRRGYHERENERDQVETRGWKRAQLSQRPPSDQRSCEKCEHECFRGPHLRVERAANHLTDRSECCNNQKTVGRTEVRDERRRHDDEAHPHRDGVRPQRRLHEQQHNRREDREQDED
jgi:hypothetical protein